MIARSMDLRKRRNHHRSSRLVEEAPAQPQDAVEQCSGAVRRRLIGQT
jgi:hypothetical protein